MRKKAAITRATVLVQQDAVLANFAKAIGHHGVSNFIESVRQREHMAITDDYARDLLSRAGYASPKPAHNA
jgi:hypothetical protein